MPENVIFYFSGTGNTKWAAQKLADTIGNCDLQPIATFDTKQKIQAKRVGIFYPVYYWGLPNIISRFADTAVIQAEYLFELHTMGGYDGVATRQLQKHLQDRGIMLSASFRLKMPNNIALISKSNQFTDVYRVPSEQAIQKLFQNSEKALTGFVPTILGCREHHYNEPLLYRPFRNYGYQLNKTECAKFHEHGNELEKSIGDQCSGCGACSKVCPVHNITMQDGKPVWNQQCEFCLACLHACPKGAINFAYSKGKKRYHLPEKY